MNNQKIPWLQALRGIAALMVVLFHARPHFQTSQLLTPVSHFFDFFFSGVDIFFVLSGFVVYSSSLRIKSIKKFAWNRITRIYFGYWPIFVIFVGSIFFSRNSGDISVSKFIGSFFLVFPNIWDNVMSTAWSLTYEIWFYIWIIVGLFLFSNSLKYYVALFILIVIYNFSFVIFNIDLVFSGHQPLRYVITGYGAEFLSGIFIAAIWEKIKDKEFNFFGVAVFFSALGVLSYIFGTGSHWFDRVEILRASTFGIFGVSALVVALSLNAMHISAPRTLVLIGDSSYSLYLLHPFLLGIGGVIRFRLNFEGSILLFYNLSLIVAVLILAFVWYRIVERRGLQLSSILWSKMCNY